MIRRILVVDDDHSMVRTLCDIFRLRGWEAHGAYSGEEAVERGRTQSYHAVLMDIKMPGMDGLAAFRRLREDAPDARVVLMTAHTEADLIRQAEKAGALRVIAKPVDLGALISLLEPEEAQPEVN